jgi:glutamate dehydrogenase (NAD(P)+)
MTDRRCAASRRSAHPRSIGATGLSPVAAEAAERFCDVRVAGARVAIQGFGAVGKHAARFLNEGGATIVAASDSTGTLLCPDGIDVPRLTAIKRAAVPG